MEKRIDAARFDAPEGRIRLPVKLRFFDSIFVPIYDFVLDVCVKIGASRDELVPFEKYAAAAESLPRPASAARALNNGAPNIERADKLVQLAARQKGMRYPTLDAIVALVDRRLKSQSEDEPRGSIDR